MDLRSPLKKVKGLGAAKNGTHHWLMQRFTAIALVPLVIWFVISVIGASMHGHSIIEFMSRPFCALLMILFLGTALYHGCLGLKVVIEDYVSNSCVRHAVVIVLNFVTIITAAAAILAIINLQTSGAKPHHGGGVHKCLKGKCPEKHHGKAKGEYDAQHHGGVDLRTIKQWKKEFHQKLEAQKAK